MGVFDRFRKLPDTAGVASNAANVSVAPDGSPVALYLALPGDADARLIHAAIPEAAEILELGLRRRPRHAAPR